MTHLPPNRAGPTGLGEPLGLLLGLGAEALDKRPMNSFLLGGSSDQKESKAMAVLGRFTLRTDPHAILTPFHSLS